MAVVIPYHGKTEQKVAGVIPYHGKTEQKVAGVIPYHGKTEELTTQAIYGGKYHHNYFKRSFKKICSVIHVRKISG